MDLDRWLAHGPVPEADWAPYVLRRAVRGELGDGGRGLLLDLVPLTQPYACESGRCTPGCRARKARSCCADLEVSVTSDERSAIEASIADIERQLAGDERWKGGTPSIFDGDAIRRSKRRCIFARETPHGLECALHAAEDASGRPRGFLKPMPCRLFPLAIVDLGDERRLLTAVHRSTASLLDAPPARVFPCLAVGAPPLYVSERETIVGLFGARVWRRMDRAVR